jgi:phosphatidylinositol-3,4,5-trisphosphate 3-phosphatase/dual-specificity protein phosphatase PTEN
MSFVRGLVSKKKIRFQQDGYDLDLAYITNRIIAMGFPSTGKESYYRNPMEQVLKFFKQYHPNAFKIYNLCSERDYDIKIFTEIGGRLETRIAFDDHNPPPLVYMFDFCKNVDEWLSQHPSHIIAVHCKAGKGRTGLMIVCYLMWCGFCRSASEALAFYGKARTTNGKGVTIPSQIRFIEYFGKCLTYGTDPLPSVSFAKTPALIYADRIVLHSIPHFDPDGGCKPYVVVQATLGKSIEESPTKCSIEYYKKWDSRKSMKLMHYSPKKSTDIELDINQEISGNIKFTFYDSKMLKKDIKMFAFWIHTAFLDQDAGVLHLEKNQLDGAIKDKEDRLFDSSFSIDFYYKIYERPQFVEIETPHRSVDNVRWLEQKTNGEKPEATEVAVQSTTNIQETDNTQIAADTNVPDS